MSQPVKPSYKHFFWVPIIKNGTLKSANRSNERRESFAGLFFLVFVKNEMAIFAPGVVKQMTEVTYICHSASKKVLTYFIFIYFILISPLTLFYHGFWRFSTRGVHKNTQKLKEVTGLIQNLPFFPSVFCFYPSVLCMCSICFIEFLGVFLLSNKGS
jgi:hypothetical protein